MRSNNASVQDLLGLINQESVLQLAARGVVRLDMRQADARAIRETLPAIVFSLCAGLDPTHSLTI